MKDISYYKDKLLKESSLLKEELSLLGYQDQKNPEDWHAKEGIQSTNQADPTELADEFEDYFERYATTEALEGRYNDVKDALERIEKGTYGKDEDTGEQISEERLEADPAARTDKPKN